MFHRVKRRAIFLFLLSPSFPFWPQVFSPLSRGQRAFQVCWPFSNGEEAIRKQIKEVNDKIDKVFSQESKVIPKDIKTLEDQITSNLDKLYQLNDLKKIAEHKKEMNQYITKKSQIIGEQSPAGSYLKELMNQKADLENRLSANREYITAPNPGVISYRVDGLEPPAGRQDTK